MSPVDYSSPFNSQKWLTRKLSLPLQYVILQTGKEKRQVYQQEGILLFWHQIPLFNIQGTVLQSEMRNMGLKGSNNLSMTYVFWVFRILLCNAFTFSFLFSWYQHLENQNLILTIFGNVYYVRKTLKPCMFLFDVISTRDSLWVIW